MSQAPLAGRPSLSLLIAVTALGPVALNIFIPSMPGLVAFFATDHGTVQLTVTLYLVALAVAQLAYGPVSDRIGRRPSLLFGLACYVAGSAACALAPSIELLIAGRILQAVGGCAGLVLSRAIIRDLFDQRRAASMIGYVTTVMALAPMLAPALGGFLDDIVGWRGSFAVCLGGGFLVLVWAMLRLSETLAPDAAPLAFSLRSYLRDHGQMFRSRRFNGYAWQTAFSSGVFFAFISGAPYAVVSLMKLPAAVYGIWFALISVGFMIGSFTAARLSTRLGIDRMIAIAAAMQLLGAGLIGLTGLMGWLNPVALFLPMAVVACANGITMPNGIAGAVSVNPRLAGTASGLVGAMQMAMGALATQIVGHWQDAWPTQYPMVWTMMGSALCAVAVFLLLNRGGARPAPGGDS